MALSIEVGSFSIGGTGNKTITLAGTFTPSRIKFWSGPRNATTETSNYSSVGHWDVGNAIQTTQSNFSGSIGHQTISSNSKALFHYANVGGAITKVTEFTGVSVAAGQFIINCPVTFNVNYPVWFEAMA